MKITKEKLNQQCSHRQKKENISTQYRNTIYNFIRKNSYSIFIFIISLYYNNHKNISFIKVLDHYFHNYRNNYIFHTPYYPGIFIILYYISNLSNTLFEICRSNNYMISILNFLGYNTDLNQRIYNIENIIAYITYHILISSNLVIIDKIISFITRGIQSHNYMVIFYLLYHYYVDDNSFSRYKENTEFIVNSSINNVSYTFVLLAIYFLLLTFKNENNPETENISKNHSIFNRLNLLSLISLFISITINNHNILFIPIFMIYTLYNCYKYSIDINNNYMNIIKYYITNVFYYIISVSIILIIYFLHVKHHKNINYSYDNTMYSLKYKNNQHSEYVDKYIMDRSLITLINERTQLYMKVDVDNEGQEKVYSGCKDENSIWRVLKVHISDEKNTDNENSSITDNENKDEDNSEEENKIKDGSNVLYNLEEKIFLQDNDIIKLVNIKTGTYLHSHTIKIDEHFYETVCYGKYCEDTSCTNITDDNDYWTIKIIESNEEDTNERIQNTYKNNDYFNNTKKYIKARTSKIVLQHQVTGTYLGFRILDSNQKININNKKDTGIEVSNSLESIKESRYFYIEDNKNDINSMNVLYNKEIELYNRAKANKNNDTKLITKIERIKYLRNKSITKVLYYPSLNIFSKILEFYNKNINKKNTNADLKIIEPYEFIIIYPLILIYMIILILNYIFYKRYIEECEEIENKNKMNKKPEKDSKKYINCFSNNEYIPYIIKFIIRDISIKLHNTYNYFITLIILFLYIPYFLTTRRYT
ncbi:hypothetical protein SLOPH_1869, partial [Spraguea lophii 42_110]